MWSYQNRTTNIPRRMSSGVGLLLCLPLVLMQRWGVCAAYGITPVIGILTQPIVDAEGINANHTMIAASYVKWIEAGGGRSIPIPYDATSELLVDDILSQVDGVLFPGGASEMPFAAAQIWKVLHSDKYYKSSGDMVPLWGTCLGFEFIVQLDSKNKESTIMESGYDATNVSWPLFNVQRIGLYRAEDVYRGVIGSNITMNNHHMGISPRRFMNDTNLARDFTITSTNYDGNGKEFVSTIEPTAENDRPIYGVQFHPEKNAFEYGLYPHTNIPYEAIDHSAEGVSFSVHMARFFVDLARKNALARWLGKSSPSTSQGKYNKVDRYPQVYSYPRMAGVEFEEVYIIPPASSWEMHLPTMPAPLLFSTFIDGSENNGRPEKDIGAGAEKQRFLVRRRT